MPPKKKKGKGKKKAKVKKKDGMAEKSRHSALQVEALHDHLALRTDMAREAQSRSVALRMRLVALQRQLEGERIDKKDIYTEMIRQYKDLQMETDARIQLLETNVNLLQGQLDTCQDGARQLREEKERILAEKNETIESLQKKINSMELEYEKILHDSLNSLLSKLSVAKVQWTEQATSIHVACKQTLQQCGLNPLDI